MRLLRFLMFSAIGAGLALTQQTAAAQTAYATLQTASCLSGVTGFLTAPGTVNVYDGPTQVASFAVSSPLTFSWPIPTGMNDSKFHVISVNVTGGTELQNSPQSFTCQGSARTYSYQTSIPSFSSVPSTGWTQNGSLSVSNGLLYSGSYGSLISTTSIVPQDYAQSNQYEYEINTGITLSPQASGGSFIHYIYGSPMALQSASGASPSGFGTYHAVELYNPTFDDVGNCTAVLNSWEKSNATAAPVLQASATVPCGPTVRMRTAVFTEVATGVVKVFSFLDNSFYVFGTSTAVGQPGVGLIGTSFASGFSSVAIGPKSIVGAAPISPPLPANQNPTTVNTSIFPAQVNIHWQQPAQDLTNVGVAQRILTRANAAGGGQETGWAPTSTDFSDSSVQPQQNYIYAESDRSFHGIWSPQTNIYVTTPAVKAVDPRRTGVRSVGSYWGGMGESIDTLSGNLNFTLPLVSAQGRNGWSVPIGLAYNSQNWRQDVQTSPAATYNWNLGQDLGYGYGWQLQLGSIVPFYNGVVYGQIDHYLFTDSTGAQHALKPGPNSLWTDQDSLYIGFDPVASVLHFRDGTFWKMGCVSGGLEPDFGTMYPTELDDTNGNQIAIRYATGYGVNWPNSSSRIVEIQDVRARPNGSNPPRTFYFTYAAQQYDPIPLHLTAINNTIGTGEIYTLSYNNTPSPANVATLVDPFSRGTYGNILALTGINLVSTSMNYGFGYDYQPGTGTSSGELIQAQLPMGGVLGWGHSTVAYNNNRSQREVTTRSVNLSGAGTSTYTFSRTFANGTDTTHNASVLSDPSGDQRSWTYLTAGNAGSNPVGLVAAQQTISASGATPSVSTPTWSLDSNGNPYVSSVLFCVYGACAKSTQALDGYGNTSTRAIFDFGHSGATTADRTYSYTYAPSWASQYVTNHIFTPLVTAAVAVAGSAAVTVVTNTYDNPVASPLSGVSCPNVNCPTEWNSAYVSNAGALQFRGNLTQSTARGVTNSYTVNVLGTRTAATNSVKTVDAAYSTATNYAAPDLVNLNGVGTLQTNYAYNAFLGTTATTDNGNGAVASSTYDTAGRLATSKTPDGSVTTYTYGTTAPFTQTATVTTSDHGQNRATITTFDGFGHAVGVVRNDSAGNLVSQTQTKYTPASCAPFGMATQVSQPYGLNGTPVFTTTTYDGAGQRLTTTLVDGSVTSVSHNGNSTTVTDAALNWKTTTTDVFGNVTSVVEPDPAAPTSNTFSTSYSYDRQNDITSVTMTRGGATQTRTFNYDPNTFQLTSKNEPETGTTSYTYNTDGTVKTKQLANNAVTTYSYDVYGRSTGWSGNLGNGTTVGWDQNNLGNTNLSSFTTNSYGRVAYKVVSCPGFYPTYDCAELFNYSPSGHVIGKKLVVYNASNHTNPAPIISLESDFSYDYEGRLSSITYPDYGGAATTYAYTFDAMGRPSGMAQGISTVVSGASFNPAGQITSLNYAAPIGTEQRAYNSLNQLTNVALGDTLNKSYLYVAGKNNGQISQSVDGISGESISYTYDSLKRLSRATASTVPHVLNRSFEEIPPPAYWTGYGQYEISDSSAHTGAYSLHVLSGGGTLSQTYFGCSTSTLYTFTGWYRVDAQQTGSVSVQINGVSYALNTLNPTPNNTWEQFTYTFKPTSCGSQAPVVQIAGTTTYLAGGVLSPGTVWFDDISITGGGGNLLSNPGFESEAVSSWTLNQARPSQIQAHEGGHSVLVNGQNGSASQTVTGGIPSTSYTLTAYAYIATPYTTAALSAGGVGMTATTAGSWQMLTASGTTDTSGNLAISLSASATTGTPQVYFDDVSISVVNPANPVVTWGELFGYDGFGNLLSETPSGGGNAPNLNINVDTGTNRVVASGVQYDAAGNMINDGTQAYTYDEANRLKTAGGSYLYAYSGLENKRILVYNNTNAATPSVTLNLYSPDGKRLGYYTFQGNSGWTTVTAGALQKFLYLGNKALTYAEDRIGSNGNYYPYGTPYSGSVPAESQAFGTYLEDSGSGLMYADQRYYRPGFGRFMTADRSNANIDYRRSTSWNRYAYTNGDPVNGMDPTGAGSLSTSDRIVAFGEGVFQLGGAVVGGIGLFGAEAGSAGLATPMVVFGAYTAVQTGFSGALNIGAAISGDSNVALAGTVVGMANPISPIVLVAAQALMPSDQQGAINAAEMAGAVFGLATDSFSALKAVDGSWSQASSVTDMVAQSFTLTIDATAFLPAASGGTADFSISVYSYADTNVACYASGGALSHLDAAGQDGIASDE